MGRTNQKMKDERRTKVAQLYFLHNRTQKEIAQALDWSEETIWHDIDFLKKDWESKTKEEALAKLIKRNEYLVQITAEEMTKASTKTEKRAWLRELRESNKELQDTLMRVGIIREAPKQVENRNINIDINPEQYIRSVLTVEPKSKGLLNSPQQDKAV